jgi:hypothetical protein
MLYELMAVFSRLALKSLNGAPKRKLNAFFDNSFSAIYIYLVI